MAITFTLGGVVRTTLVDVGSLSVTDQLNSRNTASFDMNDAAGGYRPTIGEEVVIQRDGTRIFAGFVDSYDEEVEPGLWTQLRFSISCVDYNAIADQRLVAKAYEMAAQTLADIVLDIVSTFLAGEGVTTTNVQTGPAIEKAIWNYQTIAEAFGDLADLTGYLWYIDYNKDLHFISRDTNAAPFALTDTSANFRDMKVKRTREQYRNRQIIRAGTDLTDPQTETAKGDGETRAFTFRYPMGKVPSSVTVDAVAKTIGIRGVESGKDWYWNKGDPVITQDDAGTKLTISNTLSITYQGQFPIIVLATSDAEIVSRQAVEGGTGIHEAIEDFPNVNDDEQALQVANGLIQKFGRIPRIVDFETDTDGLAAGQLLSITNTVHSLSGTWLIGAVTLSDLAGGTRLRYRVTAYDGQHLGGWEEFFRALARMGRRFVIRENEVAVYLRTTSQNVSAGESLARNDKSQAVNATASVSIEATSMTPESRVGYALVGLSEVGA